MIQASIHGRIGQDPATSQTQTGKPMCRCSIVVDVTSHNATDEESVWVGVMAFNRVAIGKAIEDELGNRRGQRTDLQAEGQGELIEELPQNFGEVKRGETSEVAAKKAGFGNPETYRQAQRPPTNSNSSSNPTQRKPNAVDLATQRNRNAIAHHRRRLVILRQR